MDENLKRLVELELQRLAQAAPASSSKSGAMPITDEWRTSVGQADEYMSLFDLDLRITFMNRLQPGVPDVVGLPVLTCIDPSKHEVFLQATAAAYVSGLPHYYETRGTGPEGRPVAYRSWVVPLSGREGPAAFASVSIDISYLGRVQRELEDQSNVLNTLVRNAPDGIVVVDHDRKILFVNHIPNGMVESDILGVVVETFLAEPYREEARSKVARVLQSGEPASYEAPLELQEGTRWYSTRIGPIVRDGKVERAVMISTDITEARRAAQDHRTLEAQLAQAQKMQALGQLTGGIAHDFNNLLTVIIGSLAMLKSGDAPKERAREWVLHADAAASRAAALTQRLLAFSRRQPLRPQTVDLRVLLSGMEQLLRRTLPADITLSVVVDEDAWLCRADPVQLESAVLNLAINARDAMPKGGALRVGASNVRVEPRSELEQEGLTPGDYVLIDVTDTGTGMEPEVLRHAFEPFFTTKDVGQGSGLGLSMVYGFAHQSGGQAKIFSQLGRGTTVRLCLPRSSRSISTGSLKAVVVPMDGAGQRVLVVEDDAAVRHVVCEMLRRGGYHAIAAEDGPSARRLLATRQDFALLLVDMMLPGGMSGAELVTIMRRERGDLPVLFMTGYSKDALSNAPEIHGTRLLPKPFTEAALIEAVREALHHGPGLAVEE
jgi:PAS domain S-box-containing protein